MRDVPGEYSDDEFLDLLTTPVYTANDDAAEEIDTEEGFYVDAGGVLRNDRLGLDLDDYGPYGGRRWRFMANQGGSRSSKTRSLAQLFVVRCMSRGEGYLVSIVRATLPALKLTALEDLKAAIADAGLTDVVEHRLGDKEFVFPTGAKIQYFSVDDPQKVRGATRVDLWMNEANELELEDFRQLNMRTTGQVFFDFNPSDDYHWIYDEVLTRDDCILIRSTYKDNPFLPASLVKEIEAYRDADENYWNIYGLGLRGVSGTTIYSHFQYVDAIPFGARKAYGLDFGWTDPASLVALAKPNGTRIAQELIYQSRLTNAELITLCKEKIGIGWQTAEIWADASRPDAIAEFVAAGFKNIKAADKSIKGGIDNVKAEPLAVTRDSSNLWAEYKAYKYKVEKATGRVLEEPVDLKNHALDALRYVCYNSTIESRSVVAPIKKHIKVGGANKAKHAPGRPGKPSAGTKWLNNFSAYLSGLKSLLNGFSLN